MPGPGAVPYLDVGSGLGQLAGERLAGGAQVVVLAGSVLLRLFTSRRRPQLVEASSDGACVSALSSAARAVVLPYCDIA